MEGRASKPTKNNDVDNYHSGKSPFPESSAYLSSSRPTYRSRLVQAAAELLAASWGAGERYEVIYTAMRALDRSAVSAVDRAFMAQSIESQNAYYRLVREVITQAGTQRGTFLRVTAEQIERVKKGLPPPVPGRPRSLKGGASTYIHRGEAGPTYLYGGSNFECPTTPSEAVQRSTHLAATSQSSKVTQLAGSGLACGAPGREEDAPQAAVCGTKGGTISGILRYKNDPRPVIRG